MRRLAFLPVTLLILLSACSSSPDDSSAGTDGTTESTGPSAASPSATPSVPSGPDCTDVWKVGEILPADYDTCIEDGAAGPQDLIECKDGTTLVAYSDTYFAITGGKIRKPDVAPMQDTEEFGKAFSTCTGE